MKRNKAYSIQDRRLTQYEIRMFPVYSETVFPSVTLVIGQQKHYYLMK